MARRKSRKAYKMGARRSRRSSGMAGGVGSVLMKGVMGAVGYGVAGMASGFVPGGFSASIKTALVLGLAYLFGLRHAVVRYGLMLSIAVIVLGYARNMVPQLLMPVTA